MNGAFESFRVVACGVCECFLIIFCGSDSLFISRTALLIHRLSLCSVSMGRDYNLDCRYAITSLAC